MVNSNTTIVKVKLWTLQDTYYPVLDSNTTIVKVKYSTSYMER